MIGPAHARAKLAWIGVGLTAACAFFVLRQWTPSGFSTCLLYNTIGTCCPGCGMTRASAHLARGDVLMSLRLHPLALPLALQAGIAWAWWGLVLFGRTRPPSPWWGIVPLTADLVGLIVTWVVRLLAGTLPG